MKTEKQIKDTSNIRLRQSIKTSELLAKELKGQEKRIDKQKLQKIQRLTAELSVSVNEIAICEGILAVNNTAKKAPAKAPTKKVNKPTPKKKPASKKKPVIVSAPVAKAVNE